ncbi:MAG: porin [bacterium]
MRFVMIGVFLVFPALVGADLTAARARVVPDARPKQLRELQAKLDQVNVQLAQLGSYLDQVKALHVQVIRLQQVVQQLERVAEAPAALDRKIDEVKRGLAELERRVGQLRLRKVRIAHQSAQVSSSSGARAGYDGGFYVASRSGNYRLTVGGVLRLTFRAGEVTGNAALEPPEKVDLLQMNLPNAMLMFSGNLFSKKLSYYLELEFGGGNTVALNDLYLHFRACQYFGVTAGQFQAGFARQQALDPYDIMFVDSSPTSLLFGRGRDIGLKLHFYQWKDRIFEEIGVFNGAGVNAGGNDNVDFLYMARVGIAPLGAVPGMDGDLRSGKRPLRFQLAGAYMFLPMPSGRDLDGKHGMDNLFVHQAAAELTAVWAGFSLNGEFFYRLEDHGAAVTELPEPEKRRRSFLGGYAQLSYTIRLRMLLQLTARYSYAEPVGFWQRAGERLSFGWSSPLAGLDNAGMPEKIHEVTAGVNLYVLKKHVKIIANYTYLNERGYTLSDSTGKQNRNVHLGSLLLQGRF